MVLDLTPEETRLADEFVTNMEDNSRTWERQRYVHLLVGLGLFVPFAIGGIWFFSWAGQKWLGILMEAETDYTFAMIVQFFIIKALIIFLFAIPTLVSPWVNALRNWNQHKRDALLAKILRAKLEEELGEDAVEHAR